MKLGIGNQKLDTMASKTFLTGMVFLFSLVALGQTTKRTTVLPPAPTPAEPRTAYQRGGDALRRGDADNAILNYTTAIDLRENLDGAYAGRGAAKRLKGDYEGALADLNESIRLNSNTQSSFYARAWVNLILHHGNEAYADAIKLLSFSEANNLVFPSHVLIAYFGLRQAKHDAEAETFLKTAAVKMGTSQWTANIMRYLKREITEDQLIALANGNKALVEARTYIGLDQSLSGKRDQALANLRWVVANSDRRSYEYAIASIEMKNALTMITDNRKDL